MTSVETIRQSVRTAMAELLDLAKVREGQLFVVGCSTSEVMGKKIGTDSHIDVAQILFDEIYKAVKAKGLNLAVQCCEHINRALVMERSAVTWEEEVNVVPQRHAGGAMAVTAYERFDDPVMVEFIKADAGLDIGDTAIGMHIKHVQVPIRPVLRSIGQAHVTALASRPKLIGGARAQYPQDFIRKI